jgi:hypothetical protein
MLWFASTLPKQYETFQGTYLHVVQCVCKVLAVEFLVWCCHMWWQEALSMVLVQISKKSNSMNVVVCSNPTQTS